MNYGELVDSVGQITKRPERIQQIQLAIAKATLKFHTVDFWLKDIIEIKGDWSSMVGNRFEITTSDKMPGFRKIAYLNGYDDVTDPSLPRVMQQFKEGDPSQIRDIYGYFKWDVYYQAGETITCWAGGTVNPATPQYTYNTGLPPRFLAGYFKLPSVQATNYKSWIADVCPFAIIDEACREIFGSIGDADEAARRKNEFAANVQIVRMNDITAGI